MADETPEKQLGSAIGALKFALRNLPTKLPISLDSVIHIREGLQACLDGFEAIDKMTHTRR